jgi:hypothetical protein
MKVTNEVMEQYIVEKLKAQTGLDGFVTPKDDPPDFLLFSERKTEVIGEIKTRSEFFEDWFVADKKIKMLKDGANFYNCIPWFIIYCKPTETTYKLDLYSDYDWEDGYASNSRFWDNRDKGRYVHVKYWQIIKPVNERMSSIDWK